MNCRPVCPEDRAPLAHLLERVDNFAPEERAVALELIDHAIQRPEEGYRVLVATAAMDGSERVIGYVCFGQTPMTESTIDFYWAAVDPETRRLGIGRRLHEAMVAACRTDGMRLLRIETSSQEAYGGTLAFHESLGYEIVSVVKDFYKSGDDLITLFLRI